MNTEKSIQIESNSNTEYSIEYGNYINSDNETTTTYLKTFPLQKPNDVVTIKKTLDLNIFEPGKTYVISVDDCLYNSLGDTIETNDTFSNPTNNFFLWTIPEAEPEAEPETEPEVEPETEPEAEPEIEPEAETETEPEVEPEIEPETEPEAEPETEPEAEPEIEPEAETETEPEVEPEIEPEIEPETEPEAEPEDYQFLALYIYDNKYIDSVNELKTFRENQGYKIDLYEVKSNDNFNSIKILVDNKYTSNNLLKYVLLFGSIEEVPTLMRGGINESDYSSELNKKVTNAASDLSYGIINNEHKIIIGRLSCGDNLYSYTTNTEELTNTEKEQNIQNQIDKIIAYENIVDSLNNDIESYDLGQDWIRKIIGIASSEGAGYGIDDLADNEYMRKELEYYETNLDCHFVELYQDYLENNNNDSTKNEYDKDGDPSPSDLITEINEGSPLLLYAGHASEITLSTTDFSVSNVDSLNNINKYFLGCIVGCSLGSHDEDYMSLSERLQVAKDKGSIAMFASSILQSWQPPMHMQRELGKAICNSDSLKTIGDIFKECISNPNFANSEDYWYYHILGDPCTRYILTLPQLKSSNNEPESEESNLDLLTFYVDSYPNEASATISNYNSNSESNIFLGNEIESG